VNRAHGDSRPAEQPALLDIHGIAHRLGVTERHIRRLVAERRIPCVKWGHLLRFDPAEIDRWLDSNRRPAMQSIGELWRSGTVHVSGSDS
jgi:excisionase family DNA binding protein